jgi:hypothetical protein
MPFQKVLLSRLHEFEENPRKMLMAEMENLKKSIVEYKSSCATEGKKGYSSGYRLVDPIIINRFNNRNGQIVKRKEYKTTAKKVV